MKSFQQLQPFFLPNVNNNNHCHKTKRLMNELPQPFGFAQKNLQLPTCRVLLSWLPRVSFPVLFEPIFLR